MSKFCMYCGRELEDDEICSCNEKTTARSNSDSSSTEEGQDPSSINSEANETSDTPTGENEYPKESEPYTQAEPINFENHSPFTGGAPSYHEGPTYIYHPPIPKDSVISTWFYRIGHYLKNFFTAPADSISKAANEKDYPVAIFFLLINAVLTSTFIMAMLRGVVTALNHAATSFTGTRYFTLNSVLQSFGFTTAGAFFFLLASIFVGNLLFCVLAFIVAKAFRSKTSFAAILGALGVSSVGVTAAFIVASIAVLIIPTLTLPIFIGYLLLNFSFTYIALIKSFKLSGNKMTYLFALVGLVYVFLMAVFINITPLSTGISNLAGLFSNITMSQGSTINSFF